jgi:hypothetical protein
MKCMKTTLAIGLLALAAVTFTACGGGEDAGGEAPRPTASAQDEWPSLPETTTAVNDAKPPPETEAQPTPTRTKPQARQLAPKFTGVHANNYEIAYYACGSFSPKKMARDFGISSTHPVDLADAYAEGYRPGFRQANYEGCLDVLLGRPSQVE